MTFPLPRRRLPLTRIRTSCWRSVTKRTSRSIVYWRMSPRKSCETFGWSPLRSFALDYGAHRDIVRLPLLRGGRVARLPARLFSDHSIRICGRRIASAHGTAATIHPVPRLTDSAEAARVGADLGLVAGKEVLAALHGAALLHRAVGGAAGPEARAVGAVTLLAAFAEAVAAGGDALGDERRTPAPATPQRPDQPRAVAGGRVEASAQRDATTIAAPWPRRPHLVQPRVEAAMELPARTEGQMPDNTTAPSRSSRAAPSATAIPLERSIWSTNRPEGQTNFAKAGAAATRVRSIANHTGFIRASCPPPTA